MADVSGRVCGADCDRSLSSESSSSPDAEQWNLAGKEAPNCLAFWAVLSCYPIPAASLPACTLFGRTDGPFLFFRTAISERALVPTRTRKKPRPPLGQKRGRAKKMAAWAAGAVFRLVGTALLFTVREVNDLSTAEVSGKCRH